MVPPKCTSKKEVANHQGGHTKKRPERHQVGPGGVNNARIRETVWGPSGSQTKVVNTKDSSKQTSIRQTIMIKERFLYRKKKSVYRTSTPLTMWARKTRS